MTVVVTVAKVLAVVFEVPNLIVVGVSAKSTLTPALEHKTSDL